MRLRQGPAEPIVRHPAPPRRAAEYVERRMELPAGLQFRRNYLDEEAQAQLLASLRLALAAAPLFRPRMPRSGKPFSVMMSNCGPLGWVSDATGYRYQPMHPETGEPWPSIPEIVLQAWADLGGYSHPPQACLINYYLPGARMGLPPGQGRGGFRRPCRLAVARRCRAVPRRRQQPQGSYKIVPARFGRCRGARRTGAARLPRHRPDSCRHVAPCCRRAGAST